MEAERTDPSQKHPIQCSVGLPQPAYALEYILTQVIYRERRKVLILHWHKNAFATFSRLPSERFRYIEAFKHVGH